MKTLSTFLLVVCLGGVASANGFLVNEFDARAVGRGNAVVATDTDPSSIYYNIGGLAAADGANVMVGGSLIGAYATFHDADTGTSTKTTTTPQFIPGVFGSWRINDQVAVGLGFYTPFGLAIDWPPTSPQANVVQNISLRTYFFTPSVGLNLHRFLPGLTLGGGVDLVPATVELKQAINVPGGTACGGAVESCTHIAGNAFGVGGRVGVMYKPEAAPYLSFGLMWRSSVKENFDGGTVGIVTPDAFRSMLPADGKATTSITVPQTLSFGVAARPADNVEVEANVLWTRWSVFRSLDITVPNAPGVSGTQVITTPEDYTNTWSVRVGGEWTLPQENLALRAGFIYDPTPIPSTTLSAQLPDVDRYDVTAGVSEKFGSRYAAHLGVLFVLPVSRTTSDVPYEPFYKGTYDVWAWVASLSFSARLD